MPANMNSARLRRRAPVEVLHQAALVASIRNKDLKLFADRLPPHKVVVTAVARKLVVIANALCKSASPGRRNPDDGSRAPRPDGAMWAIQARTEARPKATERIVHISTARHKKNHLLKSPAGLLRNGKRRTGTGRRQRGVWEAWSIQAPKRNPNAARTRIVHRFPCSPRRREPKTPVHE